ncbi:hypothetical protein D3C80_1927420 [compost metagenome]
MSVAGVHHYHPCFKDAGLDLKDLPPSGKDDAGVAHAAKSEIDGAIARPKGSTGSPGNARHMHMLRLQSLPNQRNKAFDLMSGCIQKMRHSRSSIPGNMR